MTLPEQMRSRADREERIYAAPELAKMLRAGADALEAVERLNKEVSGVWLHVQLRDRRIAELESRDGIILIRPATPADEYDFNDRYEAHWEPEAKT